MSASVNFLLAAAMILVWALSACSENVSGNENVDTTPAVSLDSVNDIMALNYNIDAMLNRGFFLRETRNEDASLDVRFYASQDADGGVHGPVKLDEVGLNKKILECLSARPKQGPYAGKERYELQVQERSAEYPQVSWTQYNVMKSLLVYDPKTVEQFKKDCVAENGLYSKEVVRVIRIRNAKDNGNVHVYNDSAATCKVMVKAVNDRIAYEDPYWKKYASKILDRCKS